MSEKDAAHGHGEQAPVARPASHRLTTPTHTLLFRHGS